ncbi:hypothetical protein G7085_04630 [Tessaracoccus sp. HDW20]|uniref:hypothetical protein n=1 Tax=Tessaracoccus coleopterorum TaxID=2714950 RepID=UPI001E3693B4|nr:hypothetical protein [Tessaracoccus coleopterorum]NHB84150.1 hypothetical protein [Tessaracoccus coleopterorum]
MLANGVNLERVSVDPIGVPRSPVEVDLDIETADDGSVYLWGVLLTDEEGTRYTSFSEFSHFSEDREVEIAASSPPGWWNWRPAGPRCWCTTTATTRRCI